ncbi:undecaprenyl-phosphate glucose phosphotransferase [Mariniblastus fucicola]|uniref:UDP-glucose:undecaprenyl-phosphate glucose-1-phosphate transferase n=1 Tax=Mariniblastus fucicola TaxID=980251 RepID=A0A5B9P6F0_9BACT|nr:undecaprenyl-phosphate glucose phosphotransferase [Mariniblastus fucicola]QEG20500.1 UDP-glucose:undecaprenyl-phosphate glucose-1-phosphate transferase [Mariniblastus fucicola]
MKKQTDNHCRQEAVSPSLTLKLLDAISIVGGLWLLVRFVPEFNSKSTIVVSLIAIGLFNIFAEVVGLYRRWHGLGFFKEIGCAGLSWAMTIASLTLLGRFSVYSTEISGPAIVWWYFLTLAIALSVRVVIRWFRRYQASRGIGTRKFAVVGINDLGIQLTENVIATPDLRMTFSGFYDDRPVDRLKKLPAPIDRNEGKIDSLVESAKSGEIQVIFITLPMRAEDRIRSIIGELTDTTASVYIVPDLFVFQMLNSRWTDIQGLPVVSVFENPLFGVDGFLKRLLDVSVASLALMIVGIPMLMIAAAVKLTSKGPILFKQKRYGLDGKQIDVWKFRSMKVCENGDKVVQAKKNDSRLTPIGGFIRKSSLDELPQIFNVLSGQMSLVGPRPHATAHNEYYRKEIEGYMLRHKVKPGMTGLAQVNGCRGETETIDKMEARIKFDHKYIRDWSIWLDLKIMFKTLFVVFSRQNAY